MRAPVYGFWNGALDAADFDSMMRDNVEVGIERAWIAALAAVGLAEKDMDQEEQYEITRMVLSEYQYISGFGDFIAANNRAAGGKFADVMNRLEMWVGRFRQAQSRALLLTKQNPPVIWEYGDTDHCEDCLYANGKIFRSKVWKKWGWETQSQKLKCGGFRCQCKMKPAPVGARLTKGHPRRPIGK